MSNGSIDKSPNKADEKLMQKGVDFIKANPISQHTPGAKLDEGKPMAGLIGDFGLALTAVAEVGTFGAKKYTRGGWQYVEDGEVRYRDAMWRHLLKENQETVDPDSGCAHAAQVAWNALARLELLLREEKKNVGA